jgi:hypothetical protein
MLKEAVDATLQTIENRTRLYRNLVVCVAIISIASILLSIILLSWVPLCGLVLLPPLTGAFLFLDSRQVRRWQARVIEMWRSGLILKEFEGTITGFRHVPPHTLNGMLSTLPKDSGQFRRDRATEEEKAFWAEKIDALGRRQEWETLIGAAALTLAIASLIGVAAFSYIMFIPFAAGLTALLIVLRKK